MVRRERSAPETGALRSDWTLPLSAELKPLPGVRRCDAWLIRFLVFFPSPYQSVIRVYDLANVSETALGQDPR